jgi:hypothetical protein
MSRIFTRIGFLTEWSIGEHEVKMCALLLWLQFGVAVCAQQGVPARILLDVRDDEGRPLPMWTSTAASQM